MNLHDSHTLGCRCAETDVDAVSQSTNRQSYIKTGFLCVFIFNSTSNVLVCETQRKVNMYGCVSE